MPPKPWTKRAIVAETFGIPTDPDDISYVNFLYARRQTGVQHRFDAANGCLGIDRRRHARGPEQWPARISLSWA